MGDLTYTYDSTNKIFFTYIPNCINTIAVASAGEYSMSEDYVYQNAPGVNMENKTYRLANANSNRYAFKNLQYTNATTFKEAVAGIKFIYVSDSVFIKPIDTYAGSFKRLETYSPYTYVTSDADILLNFNWYTWQTPKIDWVADDYFNYEDYIRISSNIDVLYEFSLSMYRPYEHKTPNYVIDYTTIPYADTWNVVNDNLYAINQNTIKLNIGNKNIYYDNGKTPNYEEFNKWEVTTVQLMEELRRKARPLPRLKSVLGRKVIGERY